MGEMSIESASSHARSTHSLSSASRLFIWRDDLDYVRILSQVSAKSDVSFSSASRLRQPRSYVTF